MINRGFEASCDKDGCPEVVKVQGDYARIATVLAVARDRGWYATRYVQYCPTHRRDV